MGRSDRGRSAEGANLYCYPPSEADGRDGEGILAFEPVSERGTGLVRYLQSLAAPDERDGLMRTYPVRDGDTDELAGYFSLKAGLVTEGDAGGGASAFDSEPGVELANFAVNGSYRKAHPEARGFGRAIYRRLILPVVRAAAKYVGVPCVYLFAPPEGKAIGAYEAYGFSRLARGVGELLHARIKPRCDESCVFMMMPLEPAA